MKTRTWLIPKNGGRPVEALTATQSARAYLIRSFGAFLVTMPAASQKQLERAYIAGCRRGERLNGKRSKRA